MKLEEDRRAKQAGQIEVNPAPLEKSVLIPSAHPEVAACAGKKTNDEMTAEELENFWSTQNMADGAHEIKRVRVQLEKCINEWN